MNFQELCACLPRNDAKLDTLATAPAAFNAVPAGVPGYIQPRFAESCWPTNASVLLIEAPGAVGKSSASREMARHLGWPLVLAERAQVGSYSLSGLIQDSLGFQSDYMSLVASGTAGIVIDSLDEALFRAGTDNFLAFIDNVQKVAGASQESTARRPSIVLFSRSEAADLIKLAFADLSHALAEINLAFFDKNGAERYIEAQLRQRYEETRRPEYNVFRASPVPFAKLRDRRLKQVAGLITRDQDVDVSNSWDFVSDFLGYAPVLTAIAESLAVTNPAALKNVTFDAASQTDLLSEIVTSILSREQSKFADNMRNKLISHSAALSDEIAYGDLYTAEEQCARLLAAVENIPLTHTAPAKLPAEVRAIYEDAAAAFMMDHPFLRRGGEFGSVVFSDFVRAKGACDIGIAVELESGPPLRTDSIGPFFARFVAGMHTEDALVVPESHAEALIRSWEQDQELSNGGGPRQPIVIMTLEGDGGAVVCDPDIGASTDQPNEVFSFSLSEVSGAYQFGSRLRRLFCFSDQGVVLGVKGQNLELGASVTIFANEIAVEADTIRVTAVIGQPATLLAKQMSATYLRHIDASVQRLVVACDDAPPLLRPYATRTNTPDDSLAHLFVNFSDFVDLRSVLLAFRPSMTGARTHHEYMLNRVIRGSYFREGIVSSLTKDDILSRSGEWLYLDTKRLASLGFGLVEMKSGEPSAAVLDFLGGVRHGLNVDPAP